jgi:hypothetical protein
MRDEIKNPKKSGKKQQCNNQFGGGDALKEAEV